MHDEGERRRGEGMTGRDGRGVSGGVAVASTFTRLINVNQQDACAKTLGALRARDSRRF